MSATKKRLLFVTLTLVSVPALGQGVRQEYHKRSLFDVYALETGRRAYAVVTTQESVYSLSLFGALRSAVVGWPVVDDYRCSYATSVVAFDGRSTASYEAPAAPSPARVFPLDGRVYLASQDRPLVMTAVDPLASRRLPAADARRLRPLFLGPYDAYCRKTGDRYIPLDPLRYGPGARRIEFFPADEAPLAVRVEARAPDPAGLTDEPDLLTVTAEGPARRSFDFPLGESTRLYFSLAARRTEPPVRPSR